MLLKKKRCLSILQITKKFLVISDREDSDEYISNEENSNEENVDEENEV